MRSAYSPTIAKIVQKLEAHQPLPALTPKNEWDSTLASQLQNASSTEFFDGTTIKDEAFGNAVKSGLLLWNDALDASHTISQGINSKTGSYWHGIMHRREPDYSNAKYWFGRVGSHPIFPSLRKRVLDILDGHSSQSHQLSEYATEIEEKANWDAFQFIDWCQAAETNADEAVIAFLQEVQIEEIKLLFDYTYQNAVS